METKVIRYRTPAQNAVFLNESIDARLGVEGLAGVVAIAMIGYSSRFETGRGLNPGDL
jgi:hypothetical protein